MFGSAGKEKPFVALEDFSNLDFAYPMRHKLSSFLSSKTAWVQAWGPWGQDKRLPGSSWRWAVILVRPGLRAFQDAGLPVPKLGRPWADQTSWSPLLPDPGITLSKLLALYLCQSDILGWGPGMGDPVRLRRSPTLLKFSKKRNSCHLWECSGWPRLTC